jgi:hypothetical protein
MRGSARSGAPDAPLAAARKRVLTAISDPGQEVFTGPAILRHLGRLRAETAPVDPPTPGDQSLLYPALHGLEADWKIQADWVTDGAGGRHRTYRIRHILPHHR